MKDITYKITFYSYWHAGGKDGANMEIDNAVLIDKNGLPYIGGKTMKGLIKDAARFIVNYQSDLLEDKFIDKIFKVEDREYSEDEIVTNKFKSAKLSYAIKEEHIKFLFHKKSSTKIIENKQADNQSLRTTEVVIPLELEGEIKNYTGKTEDIKLCFQALKKLGEKRFKGLGRCKVEITKETEIQDYV